jgi:hypothetical protein
VHDEINKPTLIIANYDVMDINFIKMLKIDQNILQLAFASCYPQGMKVVKEVEKQSKFQECVIIPQARTI